MVCKLNFDYEVLLSDESESISASDNSEDESNRYKKFILGDNILSVNPIEIISVRRLNKINSMEKVPMNYDVHYDEALTIFEEESVSETESDIYSEFTTSQEKEFEFSFKPFKYQLPIVNRFESDLQPSAKFAENIKQVSKYCFNEKSKRMKMGIDSELSTENAIQIMKKKKSNMKNNEKSILIKKSHYNEISQEFEKENLISSETLSNLPIDLLAKFINGEKSLYELSQINNKKKNPVKSKKSKRHKMNKKVNKTTESLVKPMKENSISLIKTDSLKSTDKNNLESSFAEHILCDNLIKTNTQIIENKHNPSNMRANYKSETSEILKVIQPTTKPLKNFKTSNSKSEKTKIVHSDKMFKKSDICNKSQVIKTSLDKSNLPDPNLTNCSSSDQERNEQSHKNTIHCSTVSNENNTDLPYQPKLHYETKLCNESFDPPSDNMIPVLCEQKFFENQMSLYSTIDDCKDNRTSSTDSGFQDNDSNDVSDEIHSTIPFNKNFMNVNPTKKSELDLKVKSKDNISTGTLSSVKSRLNLSSFKFNFINESVLSDKVDGNELIKYIDNKQNTTKEIQKPETLCKEDEIYLKTEFVNSISTEIVTSSDMLQDNISFNKLKCPNYYDNGNTVACSNNFSKLNDCELDLTKKEASYENITKKTTLFTQEENIVQVSHCGDYNSYGINYYYYQSDVSNKEELSQFLNYQWLRFCEKYTMYNHKLMVL